MDITSAYIAQETQLQCDQHKVVENDAEITKLYYQLLCVIYTSSIEDHIKLEDGSSPYKI